MKRGLPLWIIGVALAAGIVWAGTLTKNHLDGEASLIDRFETVLLDLRVILAGSREPPADVTIVAIDDPTVALLGKYPLSRANLAKLVNRIREAGAKALAIDMLLLGRSDEAEDMLLADSLDLLPSVIAEAGRVTDSLHTEAGVPIVETVLSPIQSAAESAEVGLANVVTDSGGTPRHIPLFFLTRNGLQTAFALKALELFLAEPPTITKTGVRIGDRFQPLDQGWHLALNYYGPGGTISTISARSMFEDEAASNVDFTGQLVVLGVTATAVGDRFSTPFDPVMPGVEIQATAMANLLDATPLIRDDSRRILDSLAALFVTILGLAAVAFLPLAPASMLYLSLLAGWLVGTVVAFSYGYWLNSALPFAASLPPVIGLIIIRQVTDRLQTRQLLQGQEALSRFQSPRLAQKIADDPGFLLKPKEQAAAILFVDLSGFTGLSEQLGAVKTRNFLKHFHTLVADETGKAEGVVLDYMGDGAMLGFGVPDAELADAAKAFKCAFSLQAAVTAWLSTMPTIAQTCRIRVGAHFGHVVLSRLGHDAQQQIAATGDCVNVASRLVDIAKDYGGTVVMSLELINAAGAASELKTPAPRCELVSIRGRKQTIQVGIWDADASDRTSIKLS
ncbi:adenylate/guanylate cyclase domain-containing protein [Roseibium polysiphoniae]|uniref:Adenylate/guanylate cyclase domain-containing protein n=1 Tax=Roseibium polysiphoniae TaxID=2571221 RepID=A0A944GTL5_9HYPH|nr:adenylate/guanylate cyclase domain-containing protein [Roseibium polysiphoniae]MBS8260590.1 adenylate/guanylate cyclase domain-containing protein [Roseibium polysiphoniae]